MASIQEPIKLSAWRHDNAYKEQSTQSCMYASMLRICTQPMR